MLKVAIRSKEGTLFLDRDDVISYGKEVKNV